MKILCVLMIALVWIPLVSADGSLFVYLPFDDGKGTDVSGNNNNGEFMGNVIKGDGKFGAGIGLEPPRRRAHRPGIQRWSHSPGSRLEWSGRVGQACFERRLLLRPGAGRSDSRRPQGDLRALMELP